MIRGENPTPVDYAQAVDHLQEEVGDVRLCLKVLEDAFPYALNTEANEQAKLNRWLDRLDRFQQGDRGVIGCISKRLEKQSLGFN